MTVQFVGSGDAFGTDGRFQACISLRWPQAHVQLDCGASSLIALKRLGLNPRSVGAVIVSHLHGDHFGGLPFLVLDQQFVRRERPLTIAGPIGLWERLLQAMDVLFPGSSSVERRFELNVLELAERMPTRVGPAEVTSLEVVHPSGAAAYGMRIRCDDKVVALSKSLRPSGQIALAPLGQLERVPEADCNHTRAQPRAPSAAQYRDRTPARRQT